MPREIRHLVAIYLLFTAFLCATSIEAPSEARTAVSARLGSASRFAPAPAIIFSILRKLGFQPSPDRPGRERLEWRPRTGPTAASVWVLPPGGEPERRLRRAASELAQAAAAHGWRLREDEWTVSLNRLRLGLEIVADGGASLSLRLVAEPAAPKPIGIARRPKAAELEPTPKPRPRPVAPVPRPGPRVAIILDDVGDVPGIEDFLALPARLTLAVMPFCRFSEASARRAVAAGHTVLLHLPLESVGGNNPGPGAIRSSWSAERIREQLLADLAAVPGAVGVNNHMGSLGTSDEALMRAILTGLKEQGLFFLDSRTVSTTVADRVAREVGERHARRDIFLDPEGASVEEIGSLLRSLATLAKRNGTAIGICHANRPHTLAALRAALPEFAASGVSVVPLTELVHL